MTSIIPAAVKIINSKYIGTLAPMTMSLTSRLDIRVSSVVHVGLLVTTVTHTKHAFNS